MEEIVRVLRDQQHRLAAIVDPLDAAGLATPSSCEGWSIADVLLHLAQTNDLAVASVEGTFDQAVLAAPRVDDVSSVDDWAGRMVAAERVDDLESLRARWHSSAEAQADAFAHTDPKARVPWVAGDLAARTLATTRFTETWIHTGDVAVGLGIDQPATDDIWHIVRLAHRTLPYAFAVAGKELAGPVRLEVRAPSGEDWTFGDDDAVTVIRGDAVEVCRVAGQRADAADTRLAGEGPDAADVLALIRTFA